MKVKVTLLDYRTERETVLGTFDFVQFSYGLLRVGPNGDSVGGLHEAGNQYLWEGHWYSDLVVSAEATEAEVRERALLQPIIERGLANADEHAQGYRRGLEVSYTLADQLRERIAEVFKWFDLARGAASKRKEETNARNDEHVD